MRAARINSADVATPRVVRLLGGNLRLAENDEGTPAFEEPIPSGGSPAFGEPGARTPADGDEVVANLPYHQQRTARIQSGDGRRAPGHWR